MRSEKSMKKLPDETTEKPVEQVSSKTATRNKKPPILEFENVSKEYAGGFVCLDGINFTISKGEFVFVVGRSGAGKSTLVKLMIREQLPSAGKVLFDGADIAEIPQHEIHLLRRRLGVVFQDFKVLPSKNVFANVAVALEVVDAPKSQIKDIVENVLNLVGIYDKAQSFPAELSGGELQRVAIARALAHEPDLFVADEPTGNIDPESSAQILDVFEKINSMGVAVLMATHDFRVVDRLKQRVVRLEKGKIVSDVAGGKY